MSVNLSFGGFFTQFTCDLVNVFYSMLFRVFVFCKILIFCVCCLDHDYSNSLLYLRKSYWEQVGSLPGFTSSRIHWRVSKIKFRRSWLCALLREILGLFIRGKIIRVLHRTRLKWDAKFPCKRYISSKISSSVAADPKVSPNWSLKTMTCHSSHCFSIVWG